MSEFVKQSKNINSGVDKVDWLVDVNYSSSFTSKIDLSFPPNLRNIIFIGKAFLFKQNYFKRKNSKVELKWWVQNLLCNGWALVQPPAEVSRGEVVCSRNEKSHKCLGTFSHKFGYTNVFKNLEAKSQSSPGWQHGSFNITVKDGGCPEFEISSISERNMGSSSPIGDYYYCRVPS